MRVGLVGSRTFSNEKLVESVVRRLLERDPEVVIVSGGARGADSIAEAVARRLCKNKPLILLADWNQYGKSAGFRRNQQIVDASDEIVAFWDGDSRGTADCVRRSLAAGKPTFVYHDGERKWLKDEWTKAFFRPAQRTLLT